MSLPLILASASPRRKEILERLGLSFAVDPARSEAPPDPSLPVERAVLAVARGKAEEVADRHPGCIVLGADTAGWLRGFPEGPLLGKPRDAGHAHAMLSALQGQEHEVLTAVWVCAPPKAHRPAAGGFLSRARVCFYPMTDGEIDRYIATGEPMDKAGAYGIQGAGLRYIRGIRGDYYTVMGLPGARASRFLRLFS